jgi:aspartyl-tRNA(Asn)/glutamyl-tRNA(Gln) amidotransferase subunit B
MNKYELVCGFETHIELSSKTKIFCSCHPAFGTEPNSSCCPVCLGLPGTLPVLNKKVIKFAIMMGIALGGNVNERSLMERKNYFYPDLPKAYQISQNSAPICSGGTVELSNGRKIRINHIHIEEDAGKLLTKDNSIFVDYNRGGTPLIEIVSEPDIRSVVEAREYIEKLQIAARYLGISDGRMQEGSLRCDVNVSVRLEGNDKLGTRVEIKNMNSIRFIENAIHYEFNRQTGILREGGKIVQETRRFNERTGETEGMREKENATDYRYFPEPDLREIVIEAEYINRLRESLPEMPEAKIKRYTEELGVPSKAASLITRYSKVACFFEDCVKCCANPKAVANFITGSIFAYLKTENSREEFVVSLEPQGLGNLVNLIEQGKINHGNAKEILTESLESGESFECVLNKFIHRASDFDINKICSEVIRDNLGAVNDYKKGKQKAFQALLGAVMKLTKGSANASEAEKILKGMIDF